MRRAPTTAMVLAAGLGTRMRPLTNDRPKPLIEVAGKPLVDHMLDRLAAAGVEHAVVNVHYLADQLERHVRTRRGAPEIIVSDERDRLLETGGALVRARRHLGEAPIYVVNTDQVWTETGKPGMAELADAFDPLAMDALLLLARRETTSGYDGAGDFFLGVDGRLGRRGSATQAPFVYTGVQILNPARLDGFPEEPFSLNRVWDQALSRARLFGVILDGAWMHVGDPAGLAAAEARYPPLPPGRERGRNCRHPTENDEPRPLDDRHGAPAMMPQTGRAPMSRTEFDTVNLDVEDRIATLTLNRPEKMNAFTGQMMLDIIAAFDKTDADDSVGAVIVTGAGKAFCAGADLSAGAKTFDYEARDDRPERGDKESLEYLRDGGGRVTLRIFESLKPVIAAVNGAAVGVGATMQLPMDIRIASEGARFGFVFARRGIVPEACSSWFLPKLVGVSTALEWCYSGRVFDAAEAKERGLVRSLHAPDALLDAARAIAREIVDNTAPVSVALTRQMLWRMLGADHPMEAHKVDSRAIFARGKSADAKEGVMSFLEKRQPNYPDTVSTGMPDFYPWWSDRPFA